MKKTLFLLGAAVFLLMACNKSETVVNEAQREISFKAVTNTPTKADPEHPGGTLNASYVMYVAASTESQKKYIQSQLFKYDSGAEALKWRAWSTTADDFAAVYWPSGTQEVDFLAIAGPSGMPVPTFNTTSNERATKDVTVGSASYDTYTNQNDIMYAVRNSVSNNTSPVTLNFQHAHALLEFKAKKETAENVTIHGITINGMQYLGSFNVDNAKTTLIPAWNLDATTANKAVYKVDDSTTNDLNFAITSSEATKCAMHLLVPEQSSKSMTITYDIGSTTGVTYELSIPRQMWKMGYIYTYVLDFNATGEITFTATVANWETGTVTPSLPSIG
jgi:hypothetical protein